MPDAQVDPVFGSDAFDDFMDDGDFGMHDDLVNMQSFNEFQHATQPSDSINNKHAVVVMLQKDPKAVGKSVISHSKHT